VQGSDVISVSGNGSSSAPFVASLRYGEQSGCDAIMGCVCDHAADGLLCSSGMLRVLPSADPDNLLRIGTDGGVYVPTAGASAGLVAGQAIDITGDQAGGYTIGARISADPDNALTLGSDGGLFVMGPRLAFGTLGLKTITTDLQDNWLIPTIDAQSGGFGLATAGGVTSVTLPDAGTWFLQAMFRCDTSAGFTATSGALFYGAIGAPRGFVGARSYSRNSSQTAMDYTVMSDFENVANPAFSFHVRASNTHAEPPPVTGWWSAHRVGPSIT
jgi:hypothetical protein